MKHESKNTGNREPNVLSLSYGRIVRRDVESNFGLLPESFETYNVVSSGDVILRLTDLQNDITSLRVGLVSETGIITSAYLALRAKPLVIAKYLYYVLHAYDASKVFYGLGGGVRQSVGFSDLKHIPIPVPTIGEQERICRFLDRATASVDELIALKEKLLSVISHKRQAVITHVVNRGFNQDNELKDSKSLFLGPIPDHWSTARIKHLCDVIVDGPHQTPHYVDEGIPFVTVRNLTSGPGIDFSNLNFISREAYKELTRRTRAERGDILLSKDGATLGVPRVVETDREFAFFVSVALLKVKRSKCFPPYLRYALESNSTWDQFKAAEAGSALKHIVLGTIGETLVPLPPLVEQVQIANRLNSFDHAHSRISDLLPAQVVRLLESRHSLVAAAVAGRIGAAAQEAA